MIRKTGYWRWAGGQKFWHRTQKGAIAAVHFADVQPQITEVATGRLIWGARS